MVGTDDERGLSWVAARVVFGRLIEIDKSANEITVVFEDEDGERFEEDYDLPEQFEEKQFEELLDYLDLNVRVTLLDNTVIRIARADD